jgi:hypothetical protein
LASFSSGGIDGAMVEDARTRWETARVLRDDDAWRARGGDGDIAGEARAARAVAIAPNATGAMDDASSRNASDRRYLSSRSTYANRHVFLWANSYDDEIVTARGN